MTFGKNKTVMLVFDLILSFIHLNKKTQLSPNLSSLAAVWLCHLCLRSVWQELFPLVDLWTVAGGEYHPLNPAVLICAGAPLLPLYQTAPWNPVELCQTICLGFCFEYPSVKLIQEDDKTPIISDLSRYQVCLPYLPVSTFWNSIIIILN